MTLQRAPKKLDGGGDRTLRDLADEIGVHYEQVRTVSLDDLIEARMAGYVGPIVQPLQAEINELRIRFATLGQLAPELPAALDRHAIAFHLCCSPSTADALIRTGRLEAVQLPGMAARVVRRETFLAYLASGE